MIEVVVGAFFVCALLGPLAITAKVLSRKFAKIDDIASRIRYAHIVNSDGDE